MTKPFMSANEKRFFIISTGLLIIFLILAGLTGQMDGVLIRIIDRLEMMHIR